MRVIRWTVVALSFFMVGVVPAFGQGVARGIGHECSLAGTWFGGANTTAKWLLTVVPIGPGRFSIVSDQGFTPAIAKLSPFSGRLDQLQNGELVGQAIALANASSVPPPQGGPNPEVWAIHETGRLTDCDTLDFDIDFYGVYIWGRTPFIDLPDGSRLPPTGVVHETYRRMATTCEVCPQ